MPRDLIPLSRAVEEFKISRSTLYEYIKAGRLTRYRQVGERRTLLDRQEIKRLLQPRKVKG